MSQTQRIVRCAIYTRKSSEEGLEQEFNSLDAQHEACSAYIMSQKSEGWKRTSVRYDDGGISGGTLERPALRRLLVDIDAGRVDLVVVYKIDRLTRSLMDFSKLVERFDKANCSFVSVTQAFNTSTSMGRLTLNVLLSFAQFEREITAERIRDKIAASKKKGMWMGGIPPIGYARRDKALIVDPAGAKVVGRVFATYLEMQCLNRLKREVDRLGYKTRPSRPGAEACPYSRGHLYNMLCNPIYVGEVRHKDQRYPGRHEAIIDRDTWDKVQSLLQSRSQRERGSARRTADGSMLVGRIFDETGDRLTPTYTSKDGRRLRYYVSWRLVDRSAAKTNDTSGWRLPAGALEAAVGAAISKGLREPNAADAAGDGDIAAMHRIRPALDTAASGNASRLLDLVEKVHIAPGRLDVSLQPEKLASLLGVRPATLPARMLKVVAQFQRRRRGVESKLIFGDEKPIVDAVLLRRIARGWAWWEEMRTGKSSRADIARREKVSPRFISMHVDTAFLAPDIIMAIVDGRQPTFLNAQALRTMNLPDLWAEQRTLFAQRGAAAAI